LAYRPTLVGARIRFLASPTDWALRADVRQAEDPGSPSVQPDELAFVIIEVEPRRDG
jgi:hypothetical protein